MEDDRGTQPDLLFSQAPTLAGGGDSARPGSRSPSIEGFPVKEWERYECLDFLGQGGMGKVYRARDRRLGRDVAIKFVRLEDERHLTRFQVEARAQARVDHPHVCKVFEVGEVDGKLFIAMQHVAGQSLEQGGGNLSLEQKVLVLRDAALGVHEAHRAGIIHRDLKPSNIMVERGEDGSLRTFVMDFGLAREWDQDVTETGSVLGTPTYMSPEQARGEVHQLDRRTDVYGLGATLYHLVTGLPPVSGGNALEILSVIGSREIPSPRTIRPELPRDLEAITMKCLERDRARRYDSARALAEDLDRYLAGDAVKARRAGLIYRTHRRFMRHKALAVTGTVATLLVLLALGVALKTQRDAGRRERLARQFTEAMGRIESVARYSALAPPHDIRTDLRAVRDELSRLQQAMAKEGVLANGPGNYALGRGFLTLDDEEKALEHLQMAWDAGYREPRVAYALGELLGRVYREKRLEAERQGDAPQRKEALRLLDTNLRDRAIGFLSQAKGSDAPSPAYLHALMAFNAGRTDEAIARLDSLEQEVPWFFEAALLRGTLFRMRGWDHWNRGQAAAALADLEKARQAFAQAALTGRSAPSVYTAQARLEGDAFLMARWNQGSIETPYKQGLRAVASALAVDPDHVPSLIQKAALLGDMADYRSARGEAAEALVEQAVGAARQALAAGPSRLDAWVALGKATYQWGSARQERNLDPVPQLGEALRVLTSISEAKRDYDVENHLGLIQQTWSDDDVQRGRDPLGHLNGAIAAYERATRMAPFQLPAWINLATCLQQRATSPAAMTPEGDLQSALEALDQAQRLNPAHVVPWFVRGKTRYHLALLMRDQGRDPEPELRLAAEAYRNGLAINPRIPNLHNGLGLVILEQARAAWDHGGDPFPLVQAAEAAYARAVAVAGGQPYGYLNLGDLLIWKARWQRGGSALRTLQAADRVLHRGLKNAPGHGGILCNLGLAAAVRLSLVHPAGGDAVALKAEGERWLSRALEKDPRNADAWLYLGELRATYADWAATVGRGRAEDFAGARGALGHALTLRPDDLQALRLKVRVLRDQAAWETSRGMSPKVALEEAEQAVGQLLKRRPGWGEALALQGSLALLEARGLSSGQRADCLQRAGTAFREAFRQNPNLLTEWRDQANKAVGSPGSGPIG